LQAGPDGELLVADPGESTLAKLQRDEEIAQLPAALEELEEMDRQLVVSHYLENLSFPELAARLTMNEATLRQRAHRAIAKLERAQRLLAALERKHVPPHYRKVLCAARLRNWSAERMANEFGLSEHAVRGLLQRAEVWIERPVPKT
jgi:DNA-directed RNA polymerase specialized sigma24 family protein